MSPSDIVISFVAGVDRLTLCDYATGVLCEALAASGNREVQIDSLGRTPAQQAFAMYKNLEKNGVANQRDLYSSHVTVPPTPLPGCRVIDVYEQAKADGHIPGDIVIAMTDEIVAIGPEHVSAHCADPKVKKVIDMYRAKFPAPNALIAALKRDPRVSKVLDEPYNGALHVEIPIPQTSPVTQAAPLA